MPRLQNIEPSPSYGHIPKCHDIEIVKAEPIAIDANSVDIKLKLLENSLVPKDLVNNLELLSKLDQDACLYIDNNGTPVRYLVKNILDVLNGVDWEGLSQTVQNRIIELEALSKETAQKAVYIEADIAQLKNDTQNLEESKQNKLIQGSNINISKDNIISVSFENTYSKHDVDTLLDSIVVDGGTIRRSE